MRLELNLPDLERLIGGDTELELSLHKQIVQEFAKRHLKEVADSTAYELALEAVKQYVNEAEDTFGIENLVTSHIWPTVGYRLKSLVDAYVKETVQKVIDETLSKTLEHQKTYWIWDIRRKIQEAMDCQIEKEVEEGIQKRLEAAETLVR
jgi:hypothetical protein